MRAFSRDLRERFGRALDRGLSARAAADLFEISPATGVRWAQAWRRTGAIEVGKVGGHKRCKLEPERDWLLVRIAEKDVTLQELRAILLEERSVAVSCDTLWRYLKRMGKTFKKRRSSARSKIVRTLPVAAPAGSPSSVK
jgi:transposase